MTRQGEKHQDATRAITQSTGVNSLDAEFTDFDYIIQPRQNLINLPARQLWESGELLYFLIWRDLKVRYKQAIIGAGWALLKPLMMMLVFVTVFGIFIRIPTGDIPYAVFIYTGLLPWILISTVIGTATASLVTNAPLLRKVYFPRLVIPLSSSLVALIDLLISLPLLLGLLLWFEIPITARVLLLPALFGMIFLLSLAIGLVMAALHVRYHDIGLLIPIFLQIWMYISPIIYPITNVPARWMGFYSINPVVGLLQGIRWALLDAPGPTPLMILSSTVGTLVILVGSVLFFQTAEHTFVDVV